MKSIVLFISLCIISSTYAYSNIWGNCAHDGYYQCVFPATYAYEEPSPNTIVGNYGQQISITMPFGASNYGHPNTVISFDDDVCLRSSQNGYFAVAIVFSSSGDANSRKHYEVKGTAPNRYALFTYANFRDGAGNRIYGQAKIFENGNVEIHIKQYTNTNGFYQLIGLDSSWGYHFPDVGSRVADYSNKAYGFYVVPPVPQAVCGNNVVDNGEQCDGGVCCNSDCTFKSTATVCRAATGFCDIAETCSGASSTCPADSFKSADTPCDEDFGVCEARLQRFCTGSSGSCSGLPVPQLNQATISWLGYNVISFGNMAANSGSIGGRTAVKGDINIDGGFSVGSDVQLHLANNVYEETIARPVTYALIGGGSVHWGDGTLSPGIDSLRTEFGYAGSSFTGASALEERFTIGAGNLDGHFSSAQDYYNALSDNFALEATNAVAYAQWGGIFFDCADNSGRYAVNVDSSLFETATWYSINESCAFGATWLINVIGNGNVLFQGGDFPSVGERVLYNVVGSGRTVTVTSGVNGNLLAPRSVFNQIGGVTKGLVIVGDISMILSTTLPQCDDLQPFDIVVPLREDIPAGALKAPVDTFSAIRTGDVFTIGDDTTAYTVTERTIEDGDRFIVFTPAVDSAKRSKAFITGTVADPNAPRNEDAITVHNNENSNAVTIATSFVVILIAFLMI